MRFAQRRNGLTTHFSERIPVVKRRISVHEKSNLVIAEAFNDLEISNALDFSLD